jgi:hypothetical protein
MLVGIWTSHDDAQRSRQRIGCAEDVRLSVSLKDALEQVHQMVQTKLVRTRSPSEPHHAEAVRDQLKGGNLSSGVARESDNAPVRPS